MSIELKQAAQDAAEAIDWLLKNIQRDAPQLAGKAMGNAEKCASVLRAALSQQPATATACGIPSMAKTTCPYCDQEFAFEHEQPATPEPVVSRNPFASRCYTMSESHLSGHRLIVGFEKLEDAQDAHEWVARQARGDFAHPAPSVPATGESIGQVFYAADGGDDETGVGYHMKPYVHWFSKALAAAADTKLYTRPAPVTGEPVYWEWRHLSIHPDTVDFGQWSEWKRVEARSAIHTIEDALAEFRTYIAQGYKYELRALYTRPVPSLPDSIDPPTEDGTEYDYASGYTAGYAAGWNEYRDGMAWLLEAN